MTEFYMSFVNDYIQLKLKGSYRLATVHWESTLKGTTVKNKG